MSTLVGARGVTAGASRRWIGRGLIIGATAAVAAVTFVGRSYYAGSPAERLRDDFHSVLKPSGLLGQSAGVLALALFLFLWLYPLRRRFRWLSFTGSLGRWLDVHIVAGLLAPLMGAIHAAWRFEGLIGLGYLSMLIVSISGIFGKYLYVHIPRRRSGAEMSRDEVHQRQSRLVADLARVLGQSEETVEKTLTDVAGRPSRAGALLRLFAGDLAVWTAHFRLRRRWKKQLRGKHELLKSCLRLARRRVALDQRIRTLHATQRFFRYWHVAHRPIAVTALVAVLIHVVVAVSLGVTWLR